MNISPLMRKALAEFLGVAFFLTAILGAVNSGSPFAAAALSTVLGLAILATASISGGHLNPAVSIYFYSRQALSLSELVTYIAAQLLGAVLGTWVGLTLWNKSLEFNGAHTSTSAPFLVAELVATGGLVWLVGRLASTDNGSKIPAAVGLWVFAAATFTPTGAEANPAVAFGLLFAGHSISETGLYMLMQLLGMLFASLFVTIFAEKKAAKVAVAEAAAPAPKTAARKPAAKKAPAKKPAAKK
ncbi:MAG: aquaporin [Micrococcales bacterium]